MKSLDINKVPRQRPHGSYHPLPGEKNQQPDFARIEPKVVSTQQGTTVNQPQPETVVAQRPAFAVAVKLAQPSQPKRKHTSFRKAYALFAFTFFVLGVGFIMGSKIISFADSISTSKSSFYKTVTENIGAVLGPIFPGLRQLDNTAVAQSIRDKGQINLLLLGYGGQGHSGSYLTDTIMLLNINFATNKVVYIPVPRDTWVQIPTSGYSGSYAKINAAYEFGLDSKHYPNKLPQFSGTDGGGNLAMYEVQQVIGIKPDFYATVDFQGFKDVVDSLGGVLVNVDNAFTDYSYPTSDATVDGPSCSAQDSQDQGGQPTDCRYTIVHFDAGLQFMDGNRTLEYARSRHAAGVEGSDFARSRRQQKLIAAIAQKAISLGALPKIFSVMNSIQGHFTTDLSIAEIDDLAKYIEGSFSGSGPAGGQNTSSIQISGSGLLVASTSSDGQWILIPAASSTVGATGQSISNFSAIHKYITDQLAVLAGNPGTTNTSSIPNAAN